MVKGYRITLHYDLIADAHSVDVRDVPPVVALTTAESSPLYAALQAALTDPAFLPAGAITGVHAHVACICPSLRFTESSSLCTPSG